VNVLDSGAGIVSQIEIDILEGYPIRNSALKMEAAQ
jgi:hypothetical protein